MINVRQLKSFFYHQPLTAAFFVAMALAAVRLWYVQVGALDLAPDEAQYWTWSTHLQASYLTKPPLIAWLIGVGTFFLGDTEVGVRLFAVIGQSGLAVLGFLVVRQYASLTVAWCAFLALCVTPLYALGGLMMSPDVPSLLLWLGALFLLGRVDWGASAEKQPIWPWVGVGLLVGLAGLAKYSAAFFYPLLGLFLLVEHRAWFLRPHIYLAGFVSLAMQAPVFWWNVQHDWVGFRHVLGQASGDSRWQGWESFFNFLGSQAGVLGPVTLLFFLGCMLCYPWVPKKHRLLYWMSVPVFMAFGVSALQAKVQANWPVLGTTVGLLLVCVMMANKAWLRRIFLVGLLLNASVSLVGHDTFVVRGWGIPWRIKADPTKEMLGWQELGAGLGEVIAQDGKEQPILLTRYQTAAQMWFYLPNQSSVFYVNPGWKRQNQYDYWPWPKVAAGQGMYYITEKPEVVPLVAAGFEACDSLGGVQVKRMGYLLQEGHVYDCKRYKGLKRLKVEKY